MQNDPLVIEDESDRQIPTAVQESPVRNSTAEPYKVEGPKCFLMMKTSESAKVIRIKVDACCKKALFECR
jgi:hypothetical protein